MTANCTCWSWWRLRQNCTGLQVVVEEEVNDEKTKKINVEYKFYLLTQNIRNSKSLTNDNMELIEILDKEKLIELVKLYNVIIINLTDFIQNYLK